MRFSLFLAGLMFSANFSFAQTQILADTYYTIQNRSGNTCLDIAQADSNDNAGLIFWEMNKNVPMNRLFKFVAGENTGEYRMVAAHSQKVLTGRGKGVQIVQTPMSDDHRQIVVLDDKEDGTLSIRFKYSQMLFNGLGGSTFAGTPVGEWVEQNNKNADNDLFRLVPYKNVEVIEKKLKATSLMSDAISAAQGGRNEVAERFFLQAVETVPSDGSILSEAGQWLLSIKSYERALDVLERALQTNDYASRSYRDLFNVHWLKREWEKAISVSDKAIQYWSAKLQGDLQNETYRNELVEVYGIKADAYNQMADWQNAIRVANEGFAIAPKTKNRQIIYAKGEALHVSAGLKAAEGDYYAAEKLIDEAIRTYENDIEMLVAKGRYNDFLTARQYLTKKISMVNIQPASVQNVLAMVVNGIDINQLVNGKQVRVKDTFPEAMKQRLRAGQAWYSLYVDFMTDGQLRMAFKNVDVGIANKVTPEGLVQIKVDSITPSVAPLIAASKNFDTFAFYWNGVTSGLNNGTGEGGGWWPLTLAGVDIGQPRGLSIMAANPEMYGVFDGLLHHEYGHVLEVIANITFVHCADLTADDKSKPIYAGWDGNCDGIYSWVLESFMKDKYKEMNWATRYPSH